MIIIRITIIFNIILLTSFSLFFSDYYCIQVQSFGTMLDQCDTEPRPSKKMKTSHNQGYCPLSAFCFHFN